MCVVRPYFHIEAEASRLLARSSFIVSVYSGSFFNNNNNTQYSYNFNYNNGNKRQPATNVATARSNIDNNNNNNNNKTREKYAQRFTFCLRAS